jgi:hypothetical protein
MFPVIRFTRKKVLIRTDLGSKGCGQSLLTFGRRKRLWTALVDTFVQASIVVPSDSLRSFETTLEREGGFHRNLLQLRLCLAVTE